MFSTTPTRWLNGSLSKKAAAPSSPDFLTVHEQKDHRALERPARTQICSQFQRSGHTRAIVAGAGRRRHRVVMAR